MHFCDDDDDDFYGDVLKHISVTSIRNSVDCSETSSVKTYKSSSKCKYIYKRLSKHSTVNYGNLASV